MNNRSKKLLCANSSVFSRSVHRNLFFRVGTLKKIALSIMIATSLCGCEQASPKLEYENFCISHSLENRDSNLNSEWLKKCMESADLGSIESKYQLAKYYYESKDKADNYVNVAFVYGISAADSNHARAQELVGDLLYAGFDEKGPDHKLALYWYQKSADQKSPSASYKASKLFREEGKEKEALEYLEKSALYGYIDALIELGDYYYYGKSPYSLDYGKAYMLYKKAAKKNSSKALYKIAKMQIKGKGTIRDIDRAIYNLEKSSNLDYTEAQFWLSSLYESGTGALSSDPLRFDKAKSLLLQAAYKDHAQSQYNLGLFFLNGIGGTREIEPAIEWLNKAAEQEVAEAQFVLGQLYFEGDLVAKDLKQALYWITRAANLGYAKAQYNLGCMYINAVGVKRDQAQGVFWIEEAAKQGHSKAETVLGELYKQGKLVEKDLEKSLLYLIRAADQGELRAYYSLADCYLKGIGVPQNDGKALILLTDAAKMGHTDSQIKLSEFYFKDYKEKSEQSSKIQGMVWLRIASGCRPEQEKYYNTLHDQLSADEITSVDVLFKQFSLYIKCGK